MTDEEASEFAADIYAEMIAAENQHPSSRALARLHASLARAWAAFHAERPGVVQTWDGTSKPPPPPPPAP